MWYLAVSDAAQLPTVGINPGALGLVMSEPCRLYYWTGTEWEDLATPPAPPPTWLTLGEWMFASAAGLPTGSQVRLDGPPASAMKALVRYVTADGVDAYWPLLDLTPNALLMIQNKGDHTQVARYTIDGTPVDRGGYIEVPLMPEPGNTALPDQRVILRVR